MHAMQAAAHSGVKLSEANVRHACRWPATLLVAIAGLSMLRAVSAADLTQAVVKQKVNVVTLAPSVAAPAQPVALGAVVRDQNVVRTGTESRAELEFPDLTLTRLGANSIFSFDAAARTINCEQGAALFAKPTSSGRIEVRSGGVAAAITGSTGFVSNQPANGGGGKARARSAGSGERTTMMGMLEGKLQGSSTWRDRNGGEHRFAFKLGPGEMIVAQPGRQPMVMQFDIPRFLATSPLINGFKSQLPNEAQLNRAVADYRADERRGFVQRTNVMVSSQPVQVAWVSLNVNHNSFDAGVDQLGGSHTSDGGFVDIGGTGILRGQLVWNTSADLDLHLILPTNQEVFYGNKTITFNNGKAVAMLDADNLGGKIDIPPSMRVENITVNGVPLNGDYTFFVNSFSASNNGSDTFTLRVSVNGHVQVITGTLRDGQNSTPVVVPFRGSGG